MLIGAAAVAAILLQPQKWREIAVLTIAWAMAPWLAAIVVTYAIVRARARGVDPFQEVVFLQAVAAELRAGDSVRGSIAGAAARATGLSLGRATRLCDAGMPMTQVASELAANLPTCGLLTAAAVEIGAESGGRIAAVFSTLAAIQTDEIELRREVRASTASIRASVVVVGGLPVVGIIYSASSGHLSRLLEVGVAGVVIVVIGGLLLVTGTGALVGLARKAGA